MKLNQKLVKACSCLGINLLEISRFVQISDVPDIACWGFDKEKKENFIFINPKTLRFSLESIQIVLKHEILHYAGYREIGGAKDRELANIALDISINKILTITYKKKMKALCGRIYPETSRKTIVSLARPDLCLNEINEKLKDLWKEIWEREEIPSPDSLYYKLLFHKEGISIGGNPFTASENAGIVLRDMPANGEDKFEKIEKEALEKVISDSQEGKLFSKQISRMFSRILVGKEGVDTKNIESFIQRLRTKQQLDDTASRMINALDGSSKIQVYPYQLSRLGLVYLACGVSKVLPLYWNKVPESRKPKLAIYIDTSPSMENYQKMEVFLVDELKDYFPTKIFAFAGDVTEINTKDFASGNYEEGYSTDFDVAIAHLLDSEFDAGIIFTDGYSSIGYENEAKFRADRKRLFTVYFTENGRPSSDLDELSEEVMVISK